jgi:addiction module RelE/StbE family toxin
MKLIWSERALSELERIGDYIGEDNPKAANRFVSRLWKRTAALKKHPRLGRIVPDANDESLREVIEGNYRIVYRLEKGSITVVTVFEGHRLFHTEDDHD